MVENVIYSVMTIICFFAGFYFGYKIRGDGKEDKLPDIKAPSTMIKEHKEKKVEEKELKELKDWIDQINNYNGEFGK